MFLKMSKGKGSVPRYIDNVDQDETGAGPACGRPQVSVPTAIVINATKAITDKEYWTGD